MLRKQRYLYKPLLGEIISLRGHYILSFLREDIKMSIGTFRAWMEAQYCSETMEDICNYGCVSGFPGLIYYSETTALYAAYQEEIWEILQESAEEYGYENVIECKPTIIPPKIA